MKVYTLVVVGGDQFEVNVYPTYDAAWEALRVRWPVTGASDLDDDELQEEVEEAYGVSVYVNAHGTD